MKKYILITLILFSFLTSGYKKPDVYKIDAVKNAYWHNNVGLRYVDDKCYYAAIQEFKIAISLNPNTQATAVYYNNLGEVYMTIGYPDYAQDCFERAITQYSMNLRFYQNLAKCYKARGLLNLKLQEYSNQKDNPLAPVMLGLLYIEQGNPKRGIITLDDFAMSEPDLLITPSVKMFIQEQVQKLK